jgi:hypothetical protein
MRALVVGMVVMVGSCGGGPSEKARAPAKPCARPSDITKAWAKEPAEDRCALKVLSGEDVDAASKFARELLYEDAVATYRLASENVASLRIDDETLHDIALAGLYEVGDATVAAHYYKNTANQEFDELAEAYVDALLQEKPSAALEFVARFEENVVWKMRAPVREQLIEPIVERGDGEIVFGWCAELVARGLPEEAVGCYAALARAGDKDLAKTVEAPLSEALLALPRLDPSILQSVAADGRFDFETELIVAETCKAGRGRFTSLRDGDATTVVDPMILMRLGQSKPEGDEALCLLHAAATSCIAHLAADTGGCRDPSTISSFVARLEQSDRKVVIDEIFDLKRRLYKFDDQPEFLLALHIVLGQLLPAGGSKHMGRTYHRDRAKRFWEDLNDTTFPSEDFFQD